MVTNHWTSYYEPTFNNITQQQIGPATGGPWSSGRGKTTSRAIRALPSRLSHSHTPTKSSASAHSRCHLHLPLRHSPPSQSKILGRALDACPRSSPARRSSAPPPLSRWPRRAAPGRWRAPARQSGGWGGRAGSFQNPGELSCCGAPVHPTVRSVFLSMRGIVSETWRGCPDLVRPNLRPCCERGSCN